MPKKTPDLAEILEGGKAGEIPPGLPQPKDRLNRAKLLREKSAARLVSFLLRRAPLVNAEPAFLARRPENLGFIAQGLLAAGDAAGASVARAGSIRTPRSQRSTLPRAIPLSDTRSPGVFFYRRHHGRHRRDTVSAELCRKRGPHLFWRNAVGPL